MNNTISINGKTYKGNDLSISGGKVYIDGKLQHEEDKIDINITVNGNLDTLEVDACNTITVKQNCKVVTCKNGNVIIHGNVEGDVTNKNGNIKCKNILGDANTNIGNIVKSFF